MVGDIRLVTLFATRAWRPDGAEPDPLQRTVTTRFAIVFQALHTGTATITSWYVDMADTAAGAVKFDEFDLSTD